LEAYAAHLRRADLGNRTTRLRVARKFVRLYPDLEVWRHAPLVERLGSVDPRRGPAYCCARVRPYLYFLIATGRLVLDWPWILGAQCHVLPMATLPGPVQAFAAGLHEQLHRLGYPSPDGTKVERAIGYFFVRHGHAVVEVGDDGLAAFAEALAAFPKREDALAIFGSPERLTANLRDLRSSVFRFHTALYHQGRVHQPPRRQVPRPGLLKVKPAMRDFIERYAAARLAQRSHPGTVDKFRNAGRHLADWLAVHHPEIASFAELTREMVLAYAASQVSAGVNIETHIGRMSSLAVLFRDTTAWEWADAPARPLLGHRDLPKRPNRVPRFIPAEELGRLMEAIRTLDCPYQRAALIIARWSGARRGEIRRLDLDCLDQYLDGTPRLRIPPGKTATERLIPLHPEAAQAIRELQALALPSRGFRDDYSGRESARLFVRRGRRLSAFYLFEAALQTACERAGLVDHAGRATITAHRFRHTVGTELVEGGARLHTVMKMLGHTSTGMTLVYAHLSDATLREEYLKVLGPGAQIAGPLAATLRAGAMPPDSIAWLKANFFRTELELGHCLRLPEEGPCECDLYLTCAKFVTTPEYAPRLRERREREIALAEEARERGFAREVERHECTRRRIEQLLVELGEAIDSSL